jgi:transcriptional regulator with XRE-family HTH domain
MEIFSARLKWVRESLGMSQRELAEQIDLTQSSYSKYEYNLREPKLETLVKLPSVLGESLDFLLGLTDFDEKAKRLYKRYSETLNSIRFNKKRIEDYLEDNDPREIKQLLERVEERIEYYESDLEAFQKEYEKYMKSIPHAKMIYPDKKEINWKYKV